MNRQVVGTLRGLSRDHLEELAIRAMIQIRQDKQEKHQNRMFLVALTGFMLGALVAASGFLTGSVLR